MQMLQKTRLKIVVVTMAVLTVVFAVGGILTAAIFSGIRNREATDSLNQIMASVRFSGPLSHMPVKDGFCVRLSSSGEHVIITYDQAVFTGADVLTYAQKLKPTQGKVQHAEGLMYKTETVSGQTLLAAIDNSEHDRFSRNLMLAYLGVASGTLVLLFGAVWLLSSWIVKPVKDSMKKQEQFICDASHELKTPLTILSATAEVLAAEQGENKWVGNIRYQTERIGKLTDDLLMLARTDGTEEAQRQSFDASAATETCVLAFESLVFERGKHLSYEIKSGVTVAGSVVDYHKAMDILLENAVKYSDENGQIRVRLKGGSTAAVEVYNTGCGVRADEQTRIFERFYRSDLSRSRETGGSGLGLSILSKLADKNKWKVSLKCEEGKCIAFTLQMRSDDKKRP